MPKFSPSYSKALLDIGEKDLESARVLSKHLDQGRVENIFCLAQQAVEKALKAYLCFRDGDFPLVHDIGVLLGKLDELPPKGYDLVSFTQFAGIRQYETRKSILDKEDIEIAIESASKVIQRVAPRISVKK